MVDASAEQIPPKPAQLILEVRLVVQQSGAVSLTDIVRLYEFRLWIYSADRLHRKRNCAALVQQSASEQLLIAAMRKPPSVQPAETRGRERLVNRRVAIDPRVPMEQHDIETSRDMARVAPSSVISPQAVPDQSHRRGEHECSFIIAPRSSRCLWLC